MFDVTKEAENLTLEIEESNLKGEWLQQPDLALKWNRYLARAQKELDAAEARLSLAKADAAAEIRDDPDTYGLTKVTVDAVKDAVVSHSVVKRKDEECREAKYQLELLRGVVFAIEQRKRALIALTEIRQREWTSDLDGMSPARRKAVSRANRTE